MHFRNIFLITWLGAIVIPTTEVIGRTLRRYAVDSLSTCMTAILMHFLLVEEDNFRIGIVLRYPTVNLMKRGLGKRRTNS